MDKHEDKKCTCTKFFLGQHERATVWVIPIEGSNFPRPVRQGPKLGTWLCNQQLRREKKEKTEKKSKNDKAKKKSINSKVSIKRSLGNSILIY